MLYEKIREQCWDSWGRHAPLSRSPSPDGPEETKLPPAGHEPSLKAKRPAPAGQRGFGAPCGSPEKSRQRHAHRPQRAHPEAALP